MHAALLILATHAPAPRPAPPLRPADLVGRWAQTWHGATDAAVYRADGTLSYYWRGEHWEGRWWLWPTTLEVHTWRADGTAHSSDRPFRASIGPIVRTRNGFACGSWKLERGKP